MFTYTYTILTTIAPVRLQHSHAVLPAYSTPEHPTPTCYAGTGLAGILGAPSGSVSPQAAAAASQPAATDAAAPTDQPDAQQQQQPMRILDGPTTNPEPPPEGLSPPMARDIDSTMDSEAGEGTLHPALYTLPSELRDPPPGADTAIGRGEGLCGASAATILSTSRGGALASSTHLPSATAVMQCGKSLEWSAHCPDRHGHSHPAFTWALSRPQLPMCPISRSHNSQM